ncbi:phosphoribosylanthranilate isomerase [Patiriisocius sp. Uisw_047]|uniref:phosphoribosylanthranilate isomerase n=1 Tax=Patiriisocius sp. Uisw_047 TaxID=3230969 RepID=UPI0039EC825F
MKHNVAQVAALQPDYLGFIFYTKSSRDYEDDVLNISEKIKRVGVFVDAPISFILKKIKAFKLDVIQLHGDESVFYINEINQNILNLPTRVKQENGVEVWKVFSVDDHFDFSKILVYENVVDKYLFDTKGKDKGGNGFAFNWRALNDYPSTKPFILSGGISLENISEVKELLQTDLPIHAIDVNSKFEDSPGLKNVEKLKKLIKEIE